MPRQAREKAESRIYHVMLRGINQQQIFEDEEDNEKFLEVLNECKAISGYKIYAYCLMGNHIHLLLKVEKESLDQIFKRIGARFVYWYNWKYHRRGYLFQDRYKSETIEDDKYLLTALRYIHQNPVKANLVKIIAEYKYSSYNTYIGERDDRITDTEFVLKMINREEFIKYHSRENNDKCLENNENAFRRTDNEAWDVIKKICNCDNTAEFQRLDDLTQKDAIKKMKNIPLSIRQISRLTGVSKGIVERTYT
jgi:REP element-mobilizing transposase RayT